MTCSETTGRVLGERRLHTLRDLAARTATVETAEACAAAAMDTFAENPADIPFALLYRLDKDRDQAHRVGLVGPPASPTLIDLVRNDAAETQGWPLARVARTAQPVLVEDVVARFGHLPGGVWPEASRMALVLPAARPGHDQPDKIMVLGISPRRALDEEYRTFLELVAGQVVTAVANARAYEEERKRVEAERVRLRALFMQAPAAIAVLRGPEHVFEFTNERYVEAIRPARRDW